MFLAVRIYIDMNPRRRSRRLMSARDREREDAKALKAAEEKTANERARLKSIDALIKRLSPRAARKTRGAFKRLHSAHKTRLRARTMKKELQKQKAKATRTFKKRAKSAKLNKENTEVAKVLMEENFPLDVALIVARDRQDLQERDKAIKKRRDKLESKITGLKSLLPGTEAAIDSVQMDIDAMVRRQQLDPRKNEREWDSEDEEGPEWLDWNINDTRRQLMGIERERDGYLTQIADLEAELKTL